MRVQKNRLKSLPPGIGNLSNMTVLYLSNNQLVSIPNEIGGLQSLWEITLFDNELTELPVEIGLSDPSFSLFSFCLCYVFFYSIRSCL
jgi:Leucine-rich repeat (LRR) protein